MALTEQEFFAALDLALPGLEEVGEAARGGKWDRARLAYVTYLKERSHPRWYFNWRERPDSEAARDDEVLRIAGDALRKRFTVVEVTHQFAGEIDWAYNPTTQPGSKEAAHHEWTWQFNRHAFWVQLGRAYGLTGDERYAAEFVSQMTGWVERNPVPDAAANGPFSRWRTIEAGIRMAHVWPHAFYYALSSQSFCPQAVLTMVASMVEHARYLRTHNTGGNWLTMEMNGLYHVGALFPEMQEAAEWRDYAAGRLRAELDAQVYPDGAQVELTPGYHNVALSNFMGVVRIAQLNGYPLPEGYLERLERMFAFNLWIMTPDRDAPPSNDSWHVDMRAQLCTGHTYFPHRNDFLWIATDGASGAPPDHLSHCFPYAGYLVQRSSWDEDACYLVLDAGPFGLGHQHEDKLSFVLHAYGRPFVVDVGSYAYDASAWRRYVLSSYGHNVVLVDGLQQNRRAERSSYVTDSPCPVVWHSSPTFDYVQATYGDTGERYGPERSLPAIQTRRIVFVKEGAAKHFWVVADTLVPQDDLEHSYEAFFHLSPSAVTVAPGTGAIETKHRSGPNLGIYPLQVPGLLAKVVEGQEEPYLQGWLPRGHGISGVNPAPTAVYTLTGRGVQHMLYVFYPVPAGEVPAVMVSRWEDAPSWQAGAPAVQLAFADGREYCVALPADDAGDLILREGRRVIS